MIPALAQERPYAETDYYNLPENVRAELIDGKIYYQAAPNRIHQEILNYLNTEINIYIRSKDGKCRVYPAPFAVKLRQDEEDIVEPDISVICDQSKLTNQGCTGAPDWIIEIVSPSNPGHDYIRKLNLYADAGVLEYWIVAPRTEKVFVYYLGQANFQMEVYTFQDKIKANIYGDLYINFPDIANLLNI